MSCLVENKIEDTIVDVFFSPFDKITSSHHKLFMIPYFKTLLINNNSKTGRHSLFIKDESLDYFTSENYFDIVINGSLLKLKNLDHDYVADLIFMSIKILDIEGFKLLFKELIHRSNHHNIKYIIEIYYNLKSFNLSSSQSSQYNIDCICNFLIEYDDHLKQLQYKISNTLTNYKLFLYDVDELSLKFVCDFDNRLLFDEIIKFYYVIDYAIKKIDTKKDFKENIYTNSDVMDNNIIKLNYYLDILDIDKLLKYRDGVMFKDLADKISKSDIIMETIQSNAKFQSLMENIGQNKITHKTLLDINTFDINKISFSSIENLEVLDENNRKSTFIQVKILYDGLEEWYLKLPKDSRVLHILPSTVVEESKGNYNSSIEFDMNINHDKIFCHIFNQLNDRVIKFIYENREILCPSYKLNPWSFFENYIKERSSPYVATRDRITSEIISSTKLYLNTKIKLTSSRGMTTKLIDSCLGVAKSIRNHDKYNIDQAIISCYIYCNPKLYISKLITNLRYGLISSLNF